MRIHSFLLLTLPLVISGWLNAQPAKKCCDDGTCQQRVIDYAVKITGLVNFLGAINEDNPSANEATLNALKASHESVYNDFLQTAKEIADYVFDKPKYANVVTCFTNALPTINKSNVIAWINYFRTVLKNPPFPSTEFCGGWKKRLEIAQGATAFLSKTKMAYLGTLRGYLIYTFSPKDKKCGGNFRLMAGPAFFLQSRNSYIALSTRLGVRLADLKANVFRYGNLNLFGGYNSNFAQFSYVEGGLEVELGPFGINLSTNYNTDNSKFGFLAGLVIANKKL
jgi:hypothetical protein